LVGIAALCLLVGLAVMWIPPTTAQAAPLLAMDQTPSRPSFAVAYARIVLSRVLAYYNGIDSNGVPTPEQEPCVSDGVLVGTVGNGQSDDYILAPTAGLSPVTPCLQVQAAYEKLNAAPASWSLYRIVVLLDVAYTGTGPRQIGSIQYTIDPAQVGTDGTSSAPRLLVLPLTGTPSHDLPVLSLPQPSDAPATGAPEMLDLTGSSGNLVARTAIDPASVVYPVDLPANNIVPQSSATPATSSASPTAKELSLGAPAIDSNGRLIGMIVADSHGNQVLAGESELASAIGAISAKFGPLMTKWQQGLCAYYGSSCPNPGAPAQAQFSQAQSLFSGLQSSYPDFGGVAPFLTAAESHSTTIAPLTQEPPLAAPTATAGQGGGTGGLSSSSIRPGTLALLIGIGLAVVILVLGVIVALVVRARGRRAVVPVAVVPPDEIGLDLLPRESMYGPLPIDITDVPTGHMPAIAKQTALRVDEAPTLVEVMRAGPAGPRRVTSLMPHAAGQTDPGVRRAREPNQDNIFALEGIRIAGGRPQPYGIFIVADGMGGHEHGAEASTVAIAIMSAEIQQGLAGTQPLDAEALIGLLRQGIARAHGELRQRNASVHADMGTTITAALVVDDCAYVANVGDSRTYLMSPDTGLRQLTTDHSIVASLAAAGVIRPEEIYTHPRRNQIYRSLGGEGEIEIDIFTAQLQAGDKLLLCSDGLWEMVRDPRIEQILRATADPRQAVDLLVREANANGGEDNISAIVVRMLEEMPERPQPGTRIIVAPQAVHR
jgi:serine/threonine protein phosphatase PrpC